MTVRYGLIVLDDSSDGANNSYIAFELHNSAIGVDAECSGHGAALVSGISESDPDQWYFCFVESRDPSISASFKYDSSLNMLTVNETWTDSSSTDDSSCGYESLRTRKISKTTTYQALGSDYLPIVCQDVGDKGSMQKQCTQVKDASIQVEVTTESL